MVEFGSWWVLLLGFLLPRNVYRDVMDGFSSVFVVSMLSLFICYIIRKKYTFNVLDSVHEFWQATEHELAFHPLFCYSVASIIKINVLYLKVLCAQTTVLHTKISWHRTHLLWTNVPINLLTRYDLICVKIAVKSQPTAYCWTPHCFVQHFSIDTLLSTLLFDFNYQTFAVCLIEFLFTVWLIFYCNIISFFANQLSVHMWN